MDSENLKLRFTLTKDPTVGKLQLAKGRSKVLLSARGAVKSFTQEDINKGTTRGSSHLCSLEFCVFFMANAHGIITENDTKYPLNKKGGFKIKKEW